MSENTNIEFVPELPPSNIGHRATGRAAQIRAALREHPGEWAIVIRSTTKTVSDLSGIARALTKGEPGKGIESATRTIDGEARIYARAVAE